MAVTTILPGQSDRLRTIRITRSVLVQGQAVEKGKTVKVAEVDAFTLIAGGQAELAEDEGKDAK